MRLCLYLPASGEWDNTMLLDQTIVPWTYLWLAYFEEWLWSDGWKGKGRHPDDRGPRQLERALLRQERRSHPGRARR